MATGLTARKLIRPEVDSHEMIVTEDYGLLIIRWRVPRRSWIPSKITVKTDVCRAERFDANYDPCAGKKIARGFIRQLSVSSVFASSPT